MPLSARVAGKRWRIAPAGGHEASLSLPIRFSSKLAHTLEYGLPSAVSSCGFSTAITVGDDAEIARRLMRAFAKTSADNPDAGKRKSDQWASVEHDHHQEVFTLLKRDDAHGLMLYLRDAHNRSLTYGITQGSFMTNVLKTRPDARRLIMLELLDHLVSLAEFLGVLDVECPDQHGKWGENIHSDPLLLIDRITATIGAQVVPPQVISSCFGLCTGHGILSTRDLLSLYAALRIKTLISTPNGPVASGSACEIGGGLGSVAYYANRLGIAQYTIIDLPLISLLQGYFLIRALPEVKIALYGEDVPDAAIRLLPTYAFASEQNSYDLLFNQDSMPEIHPDYSIGYLRGSLAKKIPLFLSINQEATRTAEPGPRPNRRPRACSRGRGGRGGRGIQVHAAFPALAAGGIC